MNGNQDNGRVEFEAECKKLMEGLKTVGGVSVHSVETSNRDGGPVIAVAYFLECFDGNGRRIVPRPSTAAMNAGEWRQTTLAITATAEEIARSSDREKLARDKMDAAVAAALRDREFFQ